jgi:N-acetylmuramoyl-L-alanine amidase
VAVDVGHSLEAPGAISARGRPEFEFNRDLARELAALLVSRGLEVFLIGEDGGANQLMDRVHQGRGARFFLSIHHDSVQERFLQTWEVEGVQRRHSDHGAGFSLFVSRHNPRWRESVACASRIGASLRAAGFVPSLYHAQRIPGESKPFADRQNGVHFYDNLVVLRHARMPAVLFEAGVIVNRDEELELLSEPRRKRMGQALAEGVVRCAL